MDVDFDFWQFLVWNIEFDELDFFSSLYWTFAGYTGIKNPVQTRKKPSVYQTRSFQLENVKTQVNIDREIWAAVTTEVAPTFLDHFALFQTHHHRGWMSSSGILYGRNFDLMLIQRITKQLTSCCGWLKWSQIILRSNVYSSSLLLTWDNIPVKNGHGVLSKRFMHFIHETSSVLSGHFGPVYLLQVSKNDDKEHWFLK